MTAQTRILELVRDEAQLLTDLGDVDMLVRLVGPSRLVLLGEATHGTHEFYRLRAELTRRLIVDKGFDAVAVEADWPAALRVSRYAQGSDDDSSAESALRGFERFPRWMWRNTEVSDWIEWLRQRNCSVPEESAQVGFFGLDLYSLRESMNAVLLYLDRTDPEAARRARARYACFDEVAQDPQAYGHAVHFGLREDCEREVLLQLRDLCGDSSRLRHDGAAATDELFYAQQNALVVRNAEAYYRTMFSGRSDSWNLRDQHMADTLHALDRHLTAQRGRPARIVVWAHNSHLGDARATESARRGQWNLGQLVRESQTRPNESFLLGFTTHTGLVAAATDWDMPVEFKPIVPSRPDSIEGLLHDSGLDRFVLALREGSDALQHALSRERLQRAIGVIYRPDTERWSHYFGASVSRQFDALVHLDTTHALQPLDADAISQHTEEPETYPSGV
ncbi:erythromycin esterase family protein [Piscinibacter sp. XHJ-5]|uniref:erythromycin esterase family protein n=1 Tax=Piscinibacter sp. XHJ-5 TaxID=3037797 RepID=UPI0024533C10|nr:erythromycin esterase family protein [Piscinibacter sp. XHJ-5]